MTEDISVTFIIPKDCGNENECSEDMQLAFLTCEQHCGGGLKAKWVHEAEFKQFEGLTKRDVFVLSEFDGDLYDNLQKTKCLLVGPRCLSCCLTEGTPIPSGPEPVFTIAMRGLVVTASGLSKQQKENIKKKVHWMGGIYSTVLTDDTTHLVSDTVMSDKYIKSAEKGIPIMSETWIEAVWDSSLKLNISGSSADFLTHKLPPFTNLQVTTSGISKKEKQLIMKLVNEHGGTFTGAFQSETTDVVVLTKEGIGSEKYKAALEYGKAVVLPTWVKDSAAKGIALPLAKYRVTGASTSSPLSGSRLPDMSLNFSRITNSRPPSNFVDETRAAPDISLIAGRMKLTQDVKKYDTSIDKDVVTAFENLDMSLIKKAGSIFDGFCVWLCGPEGAWRERAAACVARCGGVRYDAAHHRVTHTVALGSSAARAAARELPAVPVLSPLWLLRSVQAGRALNEQQFLIDTKPSTPAKSARKQQPEPASPMSKRNLALLRRGPLDLPPPTPTADVEPPDNLVHQYLSQNLPEPEKDPEPSPSRNVTVRVEPDVTENITEDATEEIEQIFRGVKIEVQGLDEEAICEIGAEVSAAGGTLAAAPAGGTHALVPLDFDTAELLTPTAEPVTVFWVKDCLSQQELVPIQYYHRPVHVTWGAGPLGGVVASLSTYSGVERAFLDELAKLLGATTQLRFCRRNTANALASTHLICPTAQGDKYQGALKWGLPAVSAAWLLACAEGGARVSERDYLVGDTKAPEPPIEEEAIPEHAPVTNEQTDPPTEPAVREEERLVSDKENDMLPPVLPAVVARRGSASSRDHTPKGKPANDPDSEMSPASRYIAMARQGLLGCDSQETPRRVHDLKQDAKQGESTLRTPPLDDVLSTPNLAAFSPTTRRRLQAVRRGEMPSGPIRTPDDPFKNPPTPDSAFGSVLCPGSGKMSPESRKRLWRVVNELPSKQQDSGRDKHTPLSEIRNRFLAQFNDDAPTPPSEHVTAPRKLDFQLPSSPEITPLRRRHEQICAQAQDTPPAKMAKLSEDQSPSSFGTTESSVRGASTVSGSPACPAAVEAQLQRLSAALTGRLSAPRARRPSQVHVHAPAPDSEPTPESQPNTVGWDDTTPAQQTVEPEQPSVQIKRFMLSSNVDNQEDIVLMISELGGLVCEGTELDPEATHLLCAAPGRSEKMLGSIAAGRWVLHPLYVTKSHAHGSFLSEEEYEWGNPQASSLPALGGAERSLARAAARWRRARADGLPGPFAGVVALLHVPTPRRRLLQRLVTAGGGLAPDDEENRKVDANWAMDAIRRTDPNRPPYTNDNITVCFADIKRYPLSDRDSAWLISKRIPVCAPVLLSSYLTNEPPPNPDEHCLPQFRP